MCAVPKKTKSIERRLGGFGSMDFVAPRGQQRGCRQSTLWTSSFARCSFGPSEQLCGAAGSFIFVDSYFVRRFRGPYVFSGSFGFDHIVGRNSLLQSNQIYPSTNRFDPFIFFLSIDRFQTLSSPVFSTDDKSFFIVGCLRLTAFVQRDLFFSKSIVAMLKLHNDRSFRRPHDQLYLSPSSYSCRIASGTAATA